MHSLYAYKVSLITSGNALFVEKISLLRFLGNLSCKPLINRGELNGKLNVMHWKHRNSLYFPVYQGI